uniref:Uncharacterized protein n=1 Tax=Pelusios castaneus TaxID=367368 RepID=A0A8C8SBS3_9SAUR
TLTTKESCGTFKDQQIYLSHKLLWAQSYFIRFMKWKCSILAVSIHTEKGENSSASLSCYIFHFMLLIKWDCAHKSLCDKYICWSLKVPQDSFHPEFNHTPAFLVSLLF